MADGAVAKAKPALVEGGQLFDHRNGRDVVLRLRGVRTQFGDNIIHDNLDFDVFRGEIVGLVGGSGTGKSVLLRTIIGLNKASRGTIELLGVDTRTLHGKAERDMQARTGVQFQDGALFSSLNVTENIIVPIREHAGLDEQTMREIAALKVAMVGLPPDTGDKKPSELSGGMRKRASLARALALDPELLFLDEPTAGLDPIGAAHYDELVKGLSRSLGLTILMVTHDLDSLYAICDRIAVLLDKRVVVGTMDELLAYDHPWVREYFHGPRGRAAGRQEQSGV
jgi:phospholipid/cholesterol/gamma-HCH transport system ATP-binding protein